MKYIDAAIERLKNKKSVNESDLSLVERILAKESDPKIAYILALDLILVGIDTVIIILLFKLFLNLKKNYFKIFFFRFQWLFVQFSTNLQRDKKNRKKFIEN